MATGSSAAPRDPSRGVVRPGFWLRANAFFTDSGITVQRVLTDNESSYRSAAFA